MPFDVCDHKIRQLIIKVGKEIRRIKGLPEESNVTILYNETAPLLGVPVVQLNSKKDGGHLPAPHEMVDTQDNFIVPRRDCPSCPDFEEKGSMILVSVCSSCEDSEHGKYKTMWQCQRCKYKEKSEKFFAQWLTELGVDFRSGTKESMGILTYKDEWIKQEK